jgi:hypothetical protein
MQRSLTLVLLASLFAACSAFAQQETNHVFITSAGITSGFQRMSAAPVQGAPYSATITNESVQTLADGNRIVQSSSGTTARDSVGRTRQDAPLPPIGHMLPADAPHLVFLQDPVAQASYTLNLTDKTATKGPSFVSSTVSSSVSSSVLSATAASTSAVFISGAAVPAATLHLQPQVIGIQQRAMIADEPGEVKTEDLGSKAMEGVTVTGTRTTRAIPAGQIGNERPLSIVTEVWTSPELKTVIYSKRSDPRMGDQTFELTNIVRAEPDPALFTVPSDFKIQDSPGPIMYKTSVGPAVP